MTQLVSPVLELLTVGPPHPTAGLDGYPAHYWFAPATSRVVSPTAGKVTRLSGHPISAGMIAGPHGPYGLSVYITAVDGTVYYLTHLAARLVRVGDSVKQGSPVGTVAMWPWNVTPPHVHMGVRSA